MSSWQAVFMSFLLSKKTMVSTAETVAKVNRRALNLTRSTPRTQKAFTLYFKKRI